MKQFLILFLSAVILTGCSAARPVIRTEESFAVETHAQDKAEDLKQRQDSGGGLRMVTSGTRAANTKTPKTKSDGIISASDKDVTSGMGAEPRTKTDQTRAYTENTTSGQATNAPQPATQVPPPSIASTRPPDDTTPDSAGEPATGAPDNNTSVPPQTAPEVTTSAESKPAALGEEDGRLSLYSLTDYYPIARDQRLHYTSSASGRFSVLLQYLHSEETRMVAQFKQVSDTGSHVSVVRISPDQISDLFYTQEIPYRTNLLGWNEYEERVILQAPLQIGHKWKSTGLEFEITAVDESRQIGPSDQIVLDVMVSGKEETIRFTYGLGIGLVSSDVMNKDGSFTNIQLIEAVEENAVDTYETEFYFPSQDQKNRAVTKTLAFKTNDLVKDKLTETYKSLAHEGGLIQVLGDDVQIQYVFRQDDLVRVDLNDAFIEFVNESPELENARIQNLVNTLCRYYQGTQGVILTIDDQRYESDNRKIEPEEVLKPAY